MCHDFHNPAKVLLTHALQVNIARGWGLEATIAFGFALC